MPDEEQFQMTVVQIKRRPRSGTDSAVEQENSSRSRGQEYGHHSHSGTEHHSHSGTGHHSHSGGTQRGGDPGSGPSTHHRHYNDFGTESLGEMDGMRSPAQTAAASAEPSKGELQQEFYHKYDAALQRRYSTRNKGKVTRILLVIALITLILLLVVFGLGSLGRQTGETLPKPEVETIPIVTLDLG